MAAFAFLVGVDAVYGASASAMPGLTMGRRHVWKRRVLAYGFWVNLAILTLAPQASAQNQPGSPAGDLPEERGCELVKNCPAATPDSSLHLPNPLSCTSFCKCDWGVARYFECPAGLHFNAELQVCDWPEGAKCTVENQ
jgi:hypothetical protein